MTVKKELGRMTVGQLFMVVNINTEHYLIHSMGLNKKQIKDMLPSEIEEHCKKVIRERIDKRGIVKTRKSQSLKK